MVVPLKQQIKEQVDLCVKLLAQYLANRVGISSTPDANSATKQSAAKQSGTKSGADDDSSLVVSEEALNLAKATRLYSVLEFYSSDNGFWIFMINPSQTPANYRWSNIVGIPFKLQHMGEEFHHAIDAFTIGTLLSVLKTMELAGFCLTDAVNHS